MKQRAIAMIDARQINDHEERKKKKIKSFFKLYQKKILKLKLIICFYLVQGFPMGSISTFGCR